jgi:hypothetical protein
VAAHGGVDDVEAGREVVELEVAARVGRRQRLAGVIEPATPFVAFAAGPSVAAGVGVGLA